MIEELNTSNIPDEVLERMWREDMQCVLISCAFSFHKNIAHLYFADNHCPDMTGAINFCKSVMPDVMQVQTFNMYGPDTVYTNTLGKWTAA